MLCRFTTGVVGGVAGTSRRRKVPSSTAAAYYCVGGDDRISFPNASSAVARGAAPNNFGARRRSTWSSHRIRRHSPCATRIWTFDSVFGRSVAFSSSAAATPCTTPPTTVSTIPETFWKELEEASQWRKDKSDWDYHRCREVVTQYDQYLEQLMKEHQQSSNDPNAITFHATDRQRLLDARTVTTAFKTLLKCKFDSPLDLRVTVRLWERRIGRLGQTEWTDHLSLRLLTANAKAGNLGRCLSLLELRAQQQFRPREREFYFTVTAISVAASAARASAANAGLGRKNTSSASSSLSYYEQTRRNIFIPDHSQDAALENPTRWLDAILMHMKQRGEPLTTSLANHMLRCYIGTGGCTGRAVHHFYRIQRHPVTTALVDDEEDDDENDTVGKDSNSQQSPQDQRPLHWLYVPEKRTHVLLPTQIKLVYKTQPPPYYKVPTQFKKDAVQSSASSPLTIIPAPLLAAFAFADSLQHGACGHDPIVLNVQSYNALLQACVVRGALTRAMHCLDQLMPANNVNPNTQSFNYLLTGLARVGDVETMQEYYQKMLHDHKLQPDTFTVQALVNGQLNRGDASAAITIVQNCFNQYNILPSYTTHLKLLEFCLATPGLVYEAKRHTYFVVQQLRHWKPSQYHTPSVVRRMERTQRHPQLQWPALQQLFAYFGEQWEGESEFQ